MQLSLIHTEQETFLDVVSLDGPRDSIGGIKSTDEDGQVKSSHNECSHSAFAMGMVAFRRIPGEMSIHSSSFSHPFPISTRPHNIPRQKHRSLIAEILDIAKHRRRLRAPYRILDRVGILEAENGLNTELWFAAVGPGSELDYFPFLESVLAPIVHYEGHVGFEVVGHVECCVVLVGVEDCGVEDHVGGRC